MIDSQLLKKLPVGTNGQSVIKKQDNNPTWKSVKIFFTNIFLNK